MGKLIRITSENDLEVYKDSPYLLWFTAEWCGPCRRLKPFVDGILPELPVDILIADLTEDQPSDSFIEKLKFKYLVRGIPNIKYIKGKDFFDMSELFREFKTEFILKFLS